MTNERAIIIQATILVWSSPQVPSYYYCIVPYNIMLYYDLVSPSVDGGQVNSGIGGDWVLREERLGNTTWYYYFYIIIIIIHQL